MNISVNAATVLYTVQQLPIWGTQIYSRKHSALWQISEALKTGTQHEKLPKGKKNGGMRNWKKKLWRETIKN